MAKKIIKAQMKQRRDTFANWAAENPVLLDGELGIVSDDPNLYKVGDGSSAWNALPFRGFDGTLAQELGMSPNAVISQKVVSEKFSELSEKIENLPKADEFDKQGNYPDLTSGFADNLVGRGESTPAEFSFRATGGKSIKDGTARIKELRGNAVVWNQMSDSQSIIGDIAHPLPQGASLTKDHKYLILASKVEGAQLYLYSMPVGGESNYNALLSPSELYSFFTSNNTIVSDGQVNSEGNIWWYQYAINENAKSEHPRLIDLTKMFGAGNEPTTIEEFYSRCPLGVDMNAYNEGEMIADNSTAIKSIGDNAWDEQWEVGGITGDGSNVDSPNRFRSKNYIKVLPNETYYCNRYLTVFFYDENNSFLSYRDMNSTTFVTPMSCGYIRFYLYGETTYNNDITISLYHSGWKAEVDNVYKPYVEDTREIDQRILDAFPNGRKPWDKVYNKNGKGYIVKGTGEVDLGTLDWDYYSSSNTSLFKAQFSNVLVQTGVAAGLLCIRYVTTNDQEWQDDKVILATPLSDGQLWIHDEHYADDLYGFIESLSGLLLYYQLAEPTIIEYDEPFNLDYEVWDFGTEQIISEAPSAPINANIIYQFNAVDMIRDHEARIAQLEALIVSLTNGGQ